MSTPTREAIETFIRITGASEPVAIRKLEEYGGNLDGAINAHFIEDDRQLPTVSSQYAAASPGRPRYEFADTSIQRRSHPPGMSFLSFARSFRPSLLLDPSYRRNLFNQIGASVSGRHDPPYVQPGELNYGYGQPYSAPRPVEEVDRNFSSHHHQNGDSDIEEQILQLAIEASKQEANDYSSIPQRQLSLEDDDLVHAISLSLKTADHENAIREQLAVENQVNLAGKELAGTAEKMKDSRFQWGGMSSEEINEAMLLETALLGENQAGTSFQHSPSSNLKSGSDQDIHLQQVSDHTSPSLVGRRMLREQQDVEYLASLLADREKEKSDSKKPVSSDCKEVEALNNVLDEEKRKRLLASKEASLPQEPAIGDENAVTLLIRLPDGSRCSRRFLKSDKLQYLFDFIDTVRVVKPQTYNLARPYPRCIFTTSDSSLSLKEVGLTNKQEALFLEMI